MKRSLLALLLLTSVAHAEPGDHGTFFDSSKFETHCVINDPGVSGSSTTDVYTHGQIACNKIQELYDEAYVGSRNFLEHAGYVFPASMRTRNVTVRILTLAELNNPDNFSNTDKACMRSFDCDSGAYFGRTFYEDSSYNINVYIAYKQLTGKYIKYSFVSTLRHEVMHAILYRYRWHYSMDDKDEHILIDKFLIWMIKK